MTLSELEPVAFRTAVAIYRRTQMIIALRHKFEVLLPSSRESVIGWDRKFLCLYVKKGRRIMDHQRVLVSNRLG
jgi:hypothetical protein